MSLIQTILRMIVAVQYGHMDYLFHGIYCLCTFSQIWYSTSESSASRSLQLFTDVYHRFGKVRLLNNNEIQRFKRVWGKFDPYNTGYIHKDQLPRFLGVYLLPYCIGLTLATPRVIRSKDIR